MLYIILFLYLFEFIKFEDYLKSWILFIYKIGEFFKRNFYNDTYRFDFNNKNSTNINNKEFNKYITFIFKFIYHLKIIYAKIYKPPWFHVSTHTIVSPLHLKQLSSFYRVIHINTIHQISLKLITITISNSTLLILHKNESIGATIKSINYVLQYSHMLNIKKKNLHDRSHIWQNHPPCAICRIHSNWPAFSHWLIHFFSSAINLHM